MTITSADNATLKEIRRLTRQRRARDRAGRFVAEGEDLLAAADAAGWSPIARLCAEGSGLTGTAVDARLLGAASTLGSGTRAIGLYAERWAQAPIGPLCVYLHGVADPGNVGAVLRSARAFGADSVALGPGSADPYGPKAVRASMGAVFEMPLVRVSAIAALPGPRVALVAPDDPATPTLASLGLQAGSLLIGAERDGLPDDLVRAADHVARIPIANHSLNAAMAATVALYETTRIGRHE